MSMEFRPDDAVSEIVSRLWRVRHADRPTDVAPKMALHPKRSVTRSIDAGDFSCASRPIRAPGCRIAAVDHRKPVVVHP
jgi:hypothetical protein